MSTAAVDRKVDIRSGRHRRNIQFTVLLTGIVLFGAAAISLLYALRPLTLRIAVGPAGSQDETLIRAMVETFAEGKAIRLVPVVVEGSTNSLALLRDSKADLAVARADLDMPANAETVAIVRKDFCCSLGFFGASRKRLKEPARPSHQGHCRSDWPSGGSYR